MKIHSKLYIFTILFSFIITLNSCGIYKKVDTREIPTEGTERAKLNIKEGRGMSIGNLRKGLGKTSYEFATSNPMWRASLEILDFIPLTTIDYSGGMIISDWYQDSSSSESAIKISIRFLSNEIAASNLKIIVHEKRCDLNQICTTVKLGQTKIKEELITSIVRKAAVLDKKARKK